LRKVTISNHNMPGSAQLISLIKQHHPLTSAEQHLITEAAIPKSLPKGGYLLRWGQQNTMIAFVVSGLLRAYYEDEAGQELTTGFLEAGLFCTDLTSFQNRGASERNIEALMPCELLVFDWTSLDRLRMLIPGCNQFEQNYLSKVLLDKIHFQRDMVNSSASEAYQRFLKQYPQAAKFAPRNQIASFLGISHYTLSRIR